LPAVVALKRYGLLTIGDGLVSQIPALVLSTAAGVLVTRTASEEPDTPLGEEISRQLFGTPKAMRVASVFVLGLALVPGLPTAPFLLLAGVLFLVARSRARQLSRDVQRAATEPTPQPQARGGPQFVPMVVPWSVEVSEDLAPILDDQPSAEGDRLGLRGRALGLREIIFSELGVPVPPPRVRAVAGLPARHVLLSLHEVPAKLVSVDGSAAGGTSHARTAATGTELDEAAVIDVITREAADLLRARAADFVGMSETQRLLDELEQFAPAVVRNVVPKPVSLMLLADVLRRLVEERMSVRDLRAILEALAVVANVEKDPLNLTEYVRGQLRRVITFKLTRGSPDLGVVLLDPTIEDTVRRAIARTPNGSFLTLPPAPSRDVVTAIRRATTEAASANPVILTQADVRRFVRKLIETDLPNVTVVSFAELLPEVSLRPLARATLVGLG
jgi:type III secretion protein V